MTDIALDIADWRLTPRRRVVWRRWQRRLLLAAMIAGFAVWALNV